MSKIFKKRILPFIVVVSMLIACLPMSVTAELANWTITNDITILEGATGGKAEYKGLNFTYYSPNTPMEEFSGGVRSNNCNGKLNGNIIVTNDTSRSWCEFIPENSGILNVQIRNAAGKTGAVNRRHKETKEIEPLVLYSPGDGSNVDNEYVTYTPGDTYETLTIEIDRNYDYLINLTGSKLVLYEVSFAGYTIVSGKVNNNFGITDYGIKFVNTETGATTVADVDCAANTYSVSLKPGYTYNAVLTGDGASRCAITDSTKEVNPTGEPITKNIDLEEVATAKLTGKITGITEGYGFNDALLKAIPTDTENYNPVVIELDKETGNFSAILLSGVEYTYELTGMWDYEVDKTPFSITADTEKDAVLKAKTLYNVSGDFIVSTGNKITDYKPIGDEISEISDIKFKRVDEENINDGYGQGYIYDGQLTDKGYTGQLRSGAYEVSFTSNTFHTVGHVIVRDADASKNIMVGYNVSPALENVPEGNDIYVSPDGTKDYKTLNEAVAAAASKNPESEKDRVTIHIAPGTYREQLVINTPYITFINDNPEDGDVILTWYYGISYKYYSVAQGGNKINALKGHYNVEYAYDKYLKDTVENWGAVVYLQSGATDFKAENIIFEHSFNRYMTEEEIEDGIECVPGKDFVRKAGVDVRVTKAKERACALYSKTDKSEFYNCQFLSDQDTVGTNGRAYFKDCIISGTTDYICGSGSNVFENCELRWSGYTDKEADGGYITAAKDDSNGYLFKNCKITASKEPGVKNYNKGNFGRPWNQAAKVLFIDTEFETKDIINDEAWTGMSGATPENAYFYETGSYFNGENGKELIDLSKRVVSKLTNPTESEMNPLTFFGDWTPVHYEILLAQLPGDFNGDETLGVNDAADLLAYVLNSKDEKFNDLTDLQLNFADVNGDGLINAQDVAFILKKVLTTDGEFEFPRKNWPTATE